MRYYLIIDLDTTEVIGKDTSTTVMNYDGWVEVTQAIYNACVVDQMCYDATTGTLSPVPFHLRKIATSTQINYPNETSDLNLQDWMDDVDDALSNIGGAVAGSYTGNGTASRTIALDFTPSAVLVIRNDTQFVDTSSNIMGGLATTGSPVLASDGDSAIAVTTNGFIVGRGTGYSTNVSTKVYNYIAFR